jgi:hypothetical protein
MAVTLHPILNLGGDVVAVGLMDKERRPDGTFKSVNLQLRLWSRVVPAGPSECWVFKGSGTARGEHGVIRAGSRAEKAHRVAWQLVNGPIPEGMCVCHRCDNPPCINPSHLFLGTIADNNRDRHQKGRRKNLEAGRAKRHAAIRARTHCPHGHAYDASNTLIRANGSRECRACSRDEARQRRDRLKESGNAS